MASEIEEIPSPLEVENQLERLLRSRRFSRAPKQAKMLSYIVRGSLDRREISEKEIAGNLFPPYDTENPIVRVTGTHLRNRLRKYYGEEGSEDPVIIRLPPGGAYKAVFVYNRRSRVDKSYRRGLYFLSSKSFEDAWKAADQFAEAMVIGKTSAPAFAARAEAICIVAMYSDGPAANRLLALAETSARESVRLNPKLWSAHASLGTVHTCRREWDKAAIAFETALSIDASETRDHSFYPAYLLANGRREEALQIVKSRADNEPGDHMALAIYGLFLYVTRRFGASERVLGQAIGMSRYNWLARAVLGCVFLATGRYTSAVPTIQTVHEVLRVRVFKGLMALARAKSGDTAQAYEMVSALEQKGENDFQLALGYMGLGETEKAVAALTLALDNCEPSMIWLHLWPVLDPLQSHEAFPDLVRRMKLPYLP